MADIPVERNTGVPWWMWLLGVLLLLGVLWFVYEMFDEDRDGRATTNANTTYNANTNASPVGATTATTTANTNIANDNMAAMNGGSTSNTNIASGNRLTDAGVYASTADKLSLVGKEAQFSNARVVRIVGPRTFTIASGNDELFVMLDDGLAQGVGTQGKINIGEMVNVTGRFERLQTAEIADIANNRFRALTDQERAFLRNTQVYLQANQIGNLN